MNALSDRTLACESCGLTYRSAAVGNTKVIDFLSVTAPGECRCPEHLRDMRCRIDLKELEVPPPAPRAVHHKAKILRPYRGYRDKVVLDVGCREAPIGHLLAESNCLIGVDTCPKSMLTATPNALDKGYKALLIADAKNLPMADEQADLVIVTDMLEHALVPEKLLAELHRVLKTGGELIVTVPNLVSYNNRTSVLLGSGTGMELHRLLKFKSPFVPYNGPRYPDQRMHLRWFTRGSLARVLEACGFGAMRSRGWDPVLSRIPGADRLFGNICLLAVVAARKE